MAKSKYEYVKGFEVEQPALPNTFLVIRVDGRGFHRFTTDHNYQKPNDFRGIQLMNKCAMKVMADYGELVLAYGQSDEYSFVLSRHSNLYGRRPSKLQTSIVSLFAASFVFHWPEFFPSQPLLYPPCFDGRTVCYPTQRNIRDYLAWRQADAHINCLFNVTFWAMVQGGMPAAAAEKALKGTSASDKHEILHQSHGVNYTKLPRVYRKGTTLVRLFVVHRPTAQQGGEAKAEVDAAKKVGEEVAADEGEKAGTEKEAVADEGEGEAVKGRGDADGLQDFAFPPAEQVRKAAQRMADGRMARIKGAKKALIQCSADLIPDTFWDSFSYVLAQQQRTIKDNSQLQHLNAHIKAIVSFQTKAKPDEYKDLV